MQHEYELIEHSIIKNFKLFLVDLDYRTSHIHRDFEICFLLDGSVTVLSRESELTAQKNDFFVLNPFQPHELKANGHALILSLQIPTDFCREYYPAIRNVEFAFCLGAKAIEKEGCQRILGTALSLSRHYFAMDREFELVCTARVNELLYQLLLHFPHTVTSKEEQRKNRRRYERARRMIEYINRNYAQRLFLSELARQENLSVTYLSHFFKEFFQMSFQEYLQSVRSEKARQLLLTTDLNLLEISLDCGFSDVKYLNKAFQKQYGCSPREYRRQSDRPDQPQPQPSLPSVQKFLSREISLQMLERYG